MNFKSTVLWLGDESHSWNQNKFKIGAINSKNDPTRELLSFQNELLHQALGGRRPLRRPHQRLDRHHLEDHHFLGGGTGGLQTHQIPTGLEALAAKIGSVALFVGCVVTWPWALNCAP